MKNNSGILFLLLFVCNLSSYALESPVNDTLSQKYFTVIPGEEYKAGSLHKFFFGEHWRELWTEPVEVPLLDLDKFAGGLEPYEMGGGMQTKSLKFYGNDGQRWKFRSINKDPSKLLPVEFRETFVEDVLQDQISSANPFAAVISAELLKAVDIMQAVPEIYVMPDDLKLGEFREIFGGMLGTIELHPDETEEGAEQFVDTDKIKGSFKLFDDIEDKRNDKVDPVALLKARLMDILIGDWDRHADQWRWARFEENDWDWWRPIPRDRDQAFVKYDGLLPTIAEYFVPQLTSFNEDYPSIEDLTWNGRHIDRRFLTELEKPVWDSIALFIRNRITDSVIVRAVNKLPEAHLEIAGEEMTHKLKTRRDNLLYAADEYYIVVNKVADVFATNKEDFALVERLDDDRTLVRVFEYEDDLDIYHGRPYFSKVFDNEVTNEIRIHLLGDADKALVKGSVESGPLIRIIGGGGADKLIDSSVVDGNFLWITPISDAENKTIFYDSGNKTEIIEGPGTVYDNSEDDFQPADLIEKYEPPQRDRGHDWIVMPLGGFNLDNGLMIGAALNLFKYDFRKIPYRYHQQIGLLYATEPKSYLIEYKGEFIDLFKGVNFELGLIKSELSFTKYFGFGNELELDQDRFDTDFYRLKQEYITAHPKLKFILSKNFSISLGGFYEFNESFLNNPGLINTFKYADYGIGSINSIGTDVRLNFDSRDNEQLPLSGVLLDLKGQYYLHTLDLNDDYIRTQFDIRWYNTFKLFRHSTLALRTGGGKVFGRYPFYDAMFLGGADNLRAFTRERFSGDASLFFQTAIRSNISELNFIVKGEFGINLFAEAGRVFVENNFSTKWHNSFGGGLWASYLDRAFIVTASFAYSAVEYNFYFDTQMAF